MVVTLSCENLGGSEAVLTEEEKWAQISRLRIKGGWRKKKPSGHGKVFKDYKE